MSIPDHILMREERSNDVSSAQTKNPLLIKLTYRTTGEAGDVPSATTNSSTDYDNDGDGLSTW